MLARVAGVAGACIALQALAGCNPQGDVGYVEIKTVPASSSVSAPSFYLDRVKLDPFRKGGAIIKQSVGTAPLAIDGGGGEMYRLCEVVVKKNRITSVTVSVMERPPRCQCRMNGAQGSSRGRVCVS
jgi:hypothetical protein